MNTSDRPTSGQNIAQKAEALLKGGVPGGDPGPGRMWWPSMLFLPLIVGLVWNGYRLCDQSGVEVIRGASFAGGGLAGLLFLVFLFKEIDIVPPSGRTTPKRAISAYFGAIRWNRYHRAYLCLSPLDRRADELMGSTASPCATFSSESHFKEYWLFKVGSATPKCLIQSVKMLRDDLAIVYLDFVLGRSNPWAGAVFGVAGTLMTYKTEGISLSKVVYLSEGLWWIADGTCEEGSDQDLIERLRSGISG